MATSSPTRDYDGTDDFLDTTDGTTYNFTTQDHSVVLWAYFDSIASYAALLGNYNGAAGGWICRSDIAGDTNMGYSKVGIADIASTVNVPTGAWIGLAWIVDVSATVDFRSLTTAGVLTSDQTANVSSITTSAAGLEIGTDGNASGDHNGALNHIQIFNRLITDSEVRNALWAPGSVANGLIGYWPGYGQLSPETDLSGTGSDATLNGTGGTRGEAVPALPIANFIT